MYHDSLHKSTTQNSLFQTAPMHGDIHLRQHNNSGSACVHPNGHCLTPVSKAHEFSFLYCISAKPPWYAFCTFVTCNQTGILKIPLIDIMQVPATNALVWLTLTSIARSAHLHYMNLHRQPVSAIVKHCHHGCHAMMRLAFQCWNRCARLPHSTLSWK